VSFDQEEWEDLEKKRAADVARQRVPELQRMRQAAVPTEMLVGSEEWDYFQTLAQERVELLEASQKAIFAALTSPMTSTAEDLWSLRCDAIRIEAEIRVWKMAVALPKVIIADAERAKAMMEALDEAAA
jgi:hypothetical protein